MMDDDWMDEDGNRCRSLPICQRPESPYRQCHSIVRQIDRGSQRRRHICSSWARSLHCHTCIDPCCNDGKCHHQSLHDQGTSSVAARSGHIISRCTIRAHHQSLHDKGTSSSLIVAHSSCPLSAFVHQPCCWYYTSAMDDSITHQSSYIHPINPSSCCCCSRERIQESMSAHWKIQCQAYVSPWNYPFIIIIHSSSPSIHHHHPFIIIIHSSSPSIHHHHPSIIIMHPSPSSTHHHHPAIIIMHPSPSSIHHHHPFIITIHSSSSSIHHHHPFIIIIHSSSPSIHHHHPFIIIIHSSSPSIHHHHPFIITIHPSSSSIHHHHASITIIHPSSSSIHHHHASITIIHPSPSLTVTTAIQFVRSVATVHPPIAFVSQPNALTRQITHEFS